MEYHEIGEKFEYDGVILEVVELGIKDDCPFCYFFDKKCNRTNHNTSQSLIYALRKPLNYDC